MRVQIGHVGTPGAESRFLCQKDTVVEDVLLAAAKAEPKIAIVVDHQNILVVIVFLDRLQVLEQTFGAGGRYGFCLKNGVDRSNQLGVLGQYLSIGDTTLPPLNNLSRLQFAD